MSSPQEDELAGTEQPFVSHLMELRDRLIRALLAIGVAFGLLCAWPARASSRGRSASSPAAPPPRWPSS
jgi:Sec-independent protein secretion pathway component TatC